MCRLHLLTVLKLILMAARRDIGNKMLHHMLTTSSPQCRSLILLRQLRHARRIHLLVVLVRHLRLRLLL